jgi:prevent-host-death family protein
MGTYSVAQAKNNLSKLIDEAQAGEPVTITRHGKPAAHITPAQAAPRRPMTQADWDWLAERRASRPSMPGSSAELIRQMRDEE